MTTEQTALYQKFTVSRQAPLRLSIAIQNFFEEGLDADVRETYSQYLRHRIQPAAAALIEADDTTRLGKLVELGWFSVRQMDGLIDLALRKKKTAALVRLLRWKAERYGFRDRNFSL